MDYLKQLDTQVFLYLNGLHNPLLDSVMYWISHKFFWIPLYALFAYLLYRFYGWKKGLIMVSVIVVAFALTNTISTEVFKYGFQRLRPCHNPSIAHLVHLVNNHCGGQFGFISSHASNVFGLAIVISAFLKGKINYITPLLLLWAAIISYSRIYLGVHYPLDIICGALFGIITAKLVYKGASFFVDLKSR